ncbi:Wzz/FepE/Etk N-terminal domain-containing protein, partial [Leucobacter soli]
MTTNASAQPGIDIRRYWDILVSRWRLVIAIALLGLLAAGAYLFIVPPTYTAVTTLSVYPLTTERYAPNRNIGNLVDMDAEAVMASSFTVAEVAAESTDGGWTAAELRGGTTAVAGA